MAAAMIVAERAPAGAQETIRAAARASFMSGFTTAVLVSAGATAIASLLAACFLPRHSPELSSSA
jgi:hypothetical protein